MQQIYVGWTAMKPPSCPQNTWYYTKTKDRFEKVTNFKYTLQSDIESTKQKLYLCKMVFAFLAKSHKIIYVRRCSCCVAIFPSPISFSGTSCQLFKNSSTWAWACMAHTLVCLDFTGVRRNLALHSPLRHRQYDGGLGKLSWKSWDGERKGPSRSR